MRLLLVSVCTLYIALAGTAHALTGESLARERTVFQQALNALDRQQMQEFDKLYAELQHYPLRPYLDYARLQPQIGQTSQAEIDRFFHQNPDSPLPQRLNRSWLQSLAQQARWQAYRDAYRAHPDQGTEYVCYQNVALLNGDGVQQAHQAARRLWLVGHSQPAACDPLFDSWIKSGKLDSSLALQRFWLAVGEDNLSLARYLERFIDDRKHLAQVDLLKQVQQKPEAILQLQTDHLSPQAHAALYGYAFKRLLRTDRIRTAQLWLTYRSQHKLDSKQQRHLDQRIAKNLAANYDAGAEPLIAQIDPTYRYSEVTEWRLRLALARQDWPAVSALATQLPDSLRQSDRWRYWQSVAAQQLAPDRQSPDKDFGSLVQERSYYGFLAAELSNRPFQLNHAQPDHQPEALNRLAQIPGFIRARELFKLERTVDANREWSRAWRLLSAAEKKTAGHLALAWGWHNRAIFNTVHTQHWDDLTARFPRVYTPLFNRNARKNKIDQTWPLAVARQESALYPAARSHAGARGLMQLMPATAKRTAHKHKIRYHGVGDLNNPSTNIALGTAYLAEMQARFGNRAHATAAYNAGPARVDRWLQERGSLPLDIWIETIPYEETRRYVQNVLAFRVIYDRLAGRRGNLLSDGEEKLLALNQLAALRKRREEDSRSL